MGGAGFTAGELLRILLHHPETEITSVTSTSNSGNPIFAVHDDLLGQTDLNFVSDLTGEEDVVFLCLGHGNSRKFFDDFKFNDRTKIIDLSNDFRLIKDANYNSCNFVYGLPEVNREKIKSAQFIANPGCFATAIQLALLPLAASHLIEEDVHVSAITGSTGAGRSLSGTTHFSWRNNNISVYKAFTHQHLGEIGETLKFLQASFENKVRFVPYRGNFTRGIYASCYTKFDKPLDDAFETYRQFYMDHPFVHVSESSIHLKQVVGTNNVILNLQKEDDQLLITSVIDNLVKGASGQAVQNMNLIFGLPEESGLHLKALQF